MKHVYCILISSLICISAYAQPEYNEMIQFLFPEFRQGVILMKSGIRNDAILNYNSLAEQMIFDKKGKKLAMTSNEIGLVDTVFIKDRKFIALDGVFVELLTHRNWDLFVEHKCELEEPGQPSGYGGTSKTSAIRSYSSIDAEGRRFQLKVPEGSTLNPYTYYWLKKNGNLDRFTNMSELKKLYKDKKDLIKAYLKKYRIKYEDQEGIIQLIEYLESN